MQQKYLIHSFIHSQGTGSGGDSTTDETQRRMSEFHKQLDELADGKRNFTFVMDDPSGNSYLQVCPKFRRDMYRERQVGSLFRRSAVCYFTARGV